MISKSKKGNKLNEVSLKKISLFFNKKISSSGLSDNNYHLIDQNQLNYYLVYKNIYNNLYYAIHILFFLTQRIGLIKQIIILENYILQYYELIIKNNNILKIHNNQENTKLNS